MTTDARVLEW